MESEILKIGNRIKQLRLQKRIKQKDLAEKLNMPISTLANYETDRRPVGLDTLYHIAEALNISINELLGESEAFENDFNVEEFDDLAKKYVVSLKTALTELSPTYKITNTVILQNLIIKQKAERDAQNFVKLDTSLARKEFDIDENGNLITGEKLYSTLYDYYKKEFFKEKLRRLEDRFPQIEKYEEDELTKVKEHYGNIPKDMIPEYILEKLYPEEIKDPFSKLSKEEQLKLRKHFDSMRIFYKGMLEALEQKIKKGGKLDADDFAQIDKARQYALSDEIQEKFKL